MNSNLISGVKPLFSPSNTSLPHQTNKNKNLNTITQDQILKHFDLIK